MKYVDRARIYIWSVIAAGSMALLHTLADLAGQTEWSWTGLAAVTTAAGFLVIKIPLPSHQGHSISVAVGECFIPVGLIAFGADVAVALAALVATMSCLRSGLKKWDRIAFNLAQFSLVTWLAGHIFASFQAPGSFWSFHNLALLTFCGLLFFLLNSGAVAAAIALSQRQSVFQFWYQHFVGLSPHELLSFLAALAFLLSFAAAAPLSWVWLAVGCGLMSLSFFYKNTQPNPSAGNDQ